jgi:hypothetical protein
VRSQPGAWFPRDIPFNGPSGRRHIRTNQPTPTMPENVPEQTSGTGSVSGTHQWPHPGISRDQAVAMT